MWARLGVGAALVDGVLIPGDLAVHDGVVVAVGLPGGGPGVAIPGFVDLQVNGYAGADVATASAGELEAMGMALARDGVLAYQPTLISGDLEVTHRGDRAGHRAGPPPGGLERCSEVRGARILGTHLEGPFLSAQRAGTHPLERLRDPDVAVAQRFLAAGQVTMMTLAPELPGALELIAKLASWGVVVSWATVPLRRRRPPPLSTPERRR